MTYTGPDPKELIAVLDTASGTRVIGRTAEPSVLALATTEELIGRPVTVAGNAITLAG